MKGGFTFDGVDIENFGLTYAPELEETYVYRSAETEIHEEEFEGHEGGYYYGINKRPKEFVLRCFFEEKVIDRGLFSQLNHLFREGRSGKLIFKRRPWCYYYATVTKFNDREITNYLNGIVTITMKAYYPCARSDIFFATRTSPNYNNIMSNSAIYDNELIVPKTSFTNITRATQFVIGNPGTENAKVSVAASGISGGGIIIENKTTNQKIKLVAMDSSINGKEVRVDGLNGRTILVNQDGSSPEPGFLYHHSGFIELAPAYPCLRDVWIDYLPGNTIHVTNRLSYDYAGYYIFADGQWRKIVSNDVNSVTVDSPVQHEGEFKSTIMFMNELEVRPVDQMNISKLSFSFKPTFA